MVWVHASPVNAGGIARAVGGAIVTTVVDGHAIHECPAVKPVRSSMNVFVLTVETDPTVTSDLVGLASKHPARASTGCQAVFMRYRPVPVDPCQQAAKMIVSAGPIHIRSGTLALAVEPTETATIGTIFAVRPRADLRRIRRPSGIAMTPPHVIVVSAPPTGEELSL
jgi:hypothetical protein